METKRQEKQEIKTVKTEKGKEGKGEEKEKIEKWKKEEKKEKEEKEMEKQMEKQIEKQIEICNDKKCPFHGSLAVRGRKFIGIVKRKNIKQKKITIEFERFIYLPKYERYLKRFTRIHAHLPDCLLNQIEIGNKVEVAETRPLSKTINHVVIRKIK